MRVGAVRWLCHEHVWRLVHRHIGFFKRNWFPDTTQAARARPGVNLAKPSMHVRSLHQGMFVYRMGYQEGVVWEQSPRHCSSGLRTAVPLVPQAVYLCVMAAMYECGLLL